MRNNRKPDIRTLDDLHIYRSDLEDELHEVEKSLSDRFIVLRDLLSFQKIIQSVTEEITRIKDLVISIIEIVKSFFSSRRKKKKRSASTDSAQTIQPPEE